MTEMLIPHVTVQMTNYVAFLMGGRVLLGETLIWFLISFFSRSFKAKVIMATEISSPPRFFHMPRFQHQAPRQLFYKRPDLAQQQAMQQLTFDGKRMRKAVNRKTIDYNPSVIKYLEVCSEPVSSASAFFSKIMILLTSENLLGHS